MSREIGYNYDYIFKLIIIGDMGTGKSCLLRQFIESQFVENLSHTIGVEFGTKNIQVKDKRIKLQIWDTAGQERFRSVTRSYYRGAAGTLLVYDITKRASFKNIQNWLADAKASTNPDSVMALIGCKLDLVNCREVSYDEAEKFAVLNDLLFYEASAKTGENVNNSFLEVSNKIYELVLDNSLDLSGPDSGVQQRVTIQPKSNLTSNRPCC